jgi:hypothetical protein
VGGRFFVFDKNRKSVYNEGMRTFKDFEALLLKEVEATSFSRATKSTGSFTELLFPMTSAQSIAIKMGNVLERALQAFIRSNAKDLTAIEKDNIKHQLDALFSSEDGTVYYFEIKANLNLDTEKSKEVAKKVAEIEAYLKSVYGEKVISRALSCRYNTAINVKNVKRAYLNETNVFGYADFFKIFGVEVSIEEWENFFKKVGATIIETAV